MKSKCAAMAMRRGGFCGAPQLRRVTLELLLGTVIMLLSIQVTKSYPTERSLSKSSLISDEGPVKYNLQLVEKPGQLDNSLSQHDQSLAVPRSSEVILKENEDLTDGALKIEEDPSVKTKRFSAVAVDVRMPYDGQIVFPDDEIIFTPVPVCEGSTFCEKTPYYPEKFISSVIRSHNSVSHLAGIVDQIIEVAVRMDLRDEPLCVSQESVIYPKTAENLFNEWLYVLNQENFLQGVRIETCLDQTKSCRAIIETYAPGYRTQCEQKYINRKLAAVTKNGTIVSDLFKMPSSCCCHIVFVGSSQIRMGPQSKAINPLFDHKKTGLQRMGGI